MFILPRQARDKHRENSKKEWRFCSDVAGSGVAGEEGGQGGGDIIHYCAVGRLDENGNELGGVRLPDLDAPVGTHAGWNTRHVGIGAPEQIVPMTGATFYFAPTPEARCVGDGRAALSERYASAGEKRLSV